MAQRSLNRRSRRDEFEDEDEYDPTDDESGPFGRDDDEDDEPPRRGRGRGRSRRDDDEEEETPRRGRRSSRRDDDDDEDEEERKPRSRRSRRDDDDEDDEPRGRKSSQGPSANATGKGWGGYKEVRKAAPSDFIDNYKLPETKEIIKFLDGEPFSVFNEHWLDDLPKGMKKSWACPGDDCPICNTGDRPKTYVMLNIVDLRDEGKDPEVVPLKASPMVADALELFAKDSKTSPLNRDDLYFSIQKTGGGKKGRVQVVINPVKARDLYEDWGIEPLSDDELADFEAKMHVEDDVVSFASRKKLKEVASELD